MNRLRLRCGKRFAAVLCLVGTAFQFNGCDFGSVTTSVTLDGREVLISLVRAAILNPIDQFITDTINNAFSKDDDD